MRDCPKCNAYVDGAKCPSCGYGEGAAKSGPVLDPNRHRCVDEVMGQRCARPGSLSESTTGGGPWYCDQHFPAFRNWNSRRTPMPAGFRQSTVANLADAELERRAMQSEEQLL